MEEVRDTLIEAGVLKQVGDTVQLTEPGALYEESARPQLEYIARELVKHFTHHGVRTVVAMKEKLILAHAVTRLLNVLPGVVVCTAQAEKNPSQDKVLIQNHWQPAIKNQRVLIVHDFLKDPLEVLLIQKLVDAVKAGGGQPIALSVIAGGDRRFDEIFRSSVKYSHQLLDHRDLMLR